MLNNCLQLRQGGSICIFQKAAITAGLFSHYGRIFYSATSFDGGSKTRQTDSPFTVMQWRRFDRYPETCNLHVHDKRF